MQKSIALKYYVMSLIYKYWLRDILLNKIKSDQNYTNLLELCDTLLINEVEERKEKWDFSIR